MNSFIYRVVKHETDIKGYWKNDLGEIYIDNIELIPIEKRVYFQATIDRLLKIEQAVFYRLDKRAFCKDKEGHTQTFNHRIILIEKNITDKYIKILLDQHGGLTIFKNADHYLIEIWK